MSGVSWDASAEDFGQKVDLTVRIREILRNYPEGLSILKELIQNADDAGARTIRFCAAEQRNIPSNSGSGGADALSNVMKGPSLLAYNSAKFTDVDFKSIQQIGDSLKKDAKGTKTGRFGVGVNSTYHLTDVPMFVSGSKVVMFDPQASFVPGINPANPGKMVDCSKANGRKLVQSLPQVFDPLKVFGCKLEGEAFDGTIFRFALRTDEQAKVSRLSRQSHPIEKMRELLNGMASVAPTMLLFLKNVECIEIYDWKASDDSPMMIHRTTLSNPTDNIRMRRSYVLNAPSRVPAKPVAVDYILEIQSTGTGVIENGGKSHAAEKWMVCNQLGGGNASVMASNEELSHMKLVPWAGVAARLSPPCDVSSGKAYCFLPLPVQTQLPVHVNGYFELSSNRRDVWSGSDMAGDGKARAEWNDSIVQSLAAPSYVRLVSAAIQTKNVTNETYELLFPQKTLSGPWELLCSEFMKGIKNLPVLYNDCVGPNTWVAPSKCILPHNEDDLKLLEILALDRLPLVKLAKKELKETLLKYRTCTTTAVPETIRKYFSRRDPKQNGSLESTDRKVEFAEYLLSYCLRGLDPTQYNQLSGCQFIPLANGDLGRFCTLPDFDYNSLQQLQSMGFSKLSCSHSLRVNKGDIDAAMEWLLKYRYENEALSVQPGIDPFLICGADSTSILRANAADTFVHLGDIEDPALKKFYSSGAASKHLNILPLAPDMLADVVARSLPRKWRGNESAEWNQDIAWPNVKWFVDLWRFICSCNDIGESLAAIAEQYCIVPTQQGIVCALSPGASVIDSNGLDPTIIQVLVTLGVRIFYDDVFPKDLVIPKAIWSYVFQPTTDGVIKVIDTALRRESSMKNGVNKLHEADKEVRNQLFRYFAERGANDISTPCKVMFRNFPIFRTYCNGNSMDTKFVPMAKAGYWYVLENATDEDRMIMTSDFLVCSGRLELELLTALGARPMSRIDFFKKVVVPQLDSVNEEVRNTIIGKILLDLPSLETENPGFSEVVSETKCIPSAATKTLKSPVELYDPGVLQLVALMEHDSFPDEYFMQSELLLGLRKLGLQTTLSWDVVLECARSIEVEGTGNDKEGSLSAKTRGSELLMFLDMNKETYFPDIKKKSNKSRTGILFRKVNAALFEDTEQKKKDKIIQAGRVTELLSIKWMPVHTEPPNPFLPWPEHCNPVAAPLDTITKDKMWLASYGKRLVDGDVHSLELQKMFGWLDEVAIKDVSLQLRMLGKTFDKLRMGIEKIESSAAEDSKGTLTINALCQKVSSEVGRIYHILNNVESEYEIDVMKSILHGSAWLWMGNAFVSSDHVAFSSSINATPYLFTVPPDLACFKSLLTFFNVRNTFGSSDFCLVLNRMAEEQKGDDIKEGWNEEKTELAVNLVQKISDDVLRLKDFEIFAPTTTGEMILASRLVYDDAPWLSKDLGGKKELTYAHTKLSASVCDKVGVQSVRKILLQSNTNMIKFGDTVVHEAFGQSESLTRRLKNIVEMYPEGPQQLSELIQNADDAKATVVKFIISKKQHGKSSLLGQKMNEWQGGGLYCFNDATFTARDFQNLSKIGQASKLQKLVTTGRFGLGFNSVFHWTDVPSLVSGDYLVMFDPHAKFVPGATDVARGIKVRFSNSELVDQFPDQMQPYQKFGCDMKNKFNGTLFRFPFRNAITAAESEISKKQYGEESAIEELLTNFKKVISKLVLFLRHVKRVEVHLEEDNDDGPKLLYYAEVAGRKGLEAPSSSQQMQSQASGFDGFRSLAANTFGMLQQSNDWNAIANYISGSGTDSQAMSKEAFYSKLLRTPENQLPQTKHLVTIDYVDLSTAECTPQSDVKKVTITDKYLICSALGAGKCRAMACNPEHMDLKFLPWAGIAAHLSRNGHAPPSIRGNAFCFLPLPAETGFSVHLNGYFELSANRRDIWFGDDMSGGGKVRSEWNRLLLSDVVSPLYTQVLLTARSLLGPGKQYDSLWPVSVSSDIWKIVRSRVYSLANNLPLVYTMLDGGKWCSLVSAVFLDSPEYSDQKSSNEAQIITKKTLMAILLQEKISVVSMSPAVISCMNDEKCGILTVSPQMVREWFRRPNNHPSLHDRENVVFLLKYCIDDLVENRHFNKLYGLPLLPLLNGLNGNIGSPESNERYFVPTEAEKELLFHASFVLVDPSTSDSRLNDQLKSEDFHSLTNVKLLNMSSFAKLLSHAYPPEWLGLPEIRWNPKAASKDASPENEVWLSKLWDYIVLDKDNSGENLSHFENYLQIVPTVIGEGEKTLQMLTKDMAVVNIMESDNEDVAKILRSIGIRTFDTSVFTDKGTVCRTLNKYIQPPTVRGIMKALTNSVPDASAEERNERMAARFQYLSKTEKLKFRTYLRDSDDISPNREEIVTLRSLPIFEVFALGKKEEFSCLTADSFLPPSCAERSHLDSHFVKATSRKDVTFLEALGLTTMSPVDYYGLYLCDSLAQNRIIQEGRSSAVTKMLQDIPALSEEDGGQNLISTISNVAFVPNSRGQMVKPKDLYDPHEPGIVDLVDDSMLPAKELRHGGVLQTLRLMGMQSKLSSDGIIESAKRIEYEAKNLSIQDVIDEVKTLALRKRATSLLNFLDDDETVESFLSDVTELKPTSTDSSETGEIELTFVEDTYSNDVISELNSICWLPVERSLANIGSNEPRPPRRQHQLSNIGISSPVATRPKSDEWICSKSTDILSLTLKSESLLKLFKWSLPPKISSVASQIVALAKLSEQHSESQSLRQHLPTVTSQIYEILDSQIDTTSMEEKEKLTLLFHQNPWIWVGDRFVTTAQVAFNAPDNAKPFLYTVPSAIESFSNLLELCGVRESFSGKDFVQLLSSLSNQLKGNQCDARQLDLSIFVSRYLSRVSQEELDTLDKSQIYLPSKDKIMHRARDMTFDDAPWLSAIVKRTRHIFVHPDVGNEVARVLGSKSLRDVLSANQNGMVKVPCPKHDALRQLLKNRSFNQKEMGRVVLELMELAEMRSAKQVSISLDRRSHGTMSLLHPCLAAAQGPALVVCFHDVAIDVDEIVKLTSPVNYYNSSTSGNGGCGGNGYPRYGRGLCGSFSMTDCLQVLSGRSLVIFDPNGEYFIEDQFMEERKSSSENSDQGSQVIQNINKKKKEKACARNYGISQSFCNQFPDQFDPFLSLPYGVSESLTNGTSSSGGSYYRGTVIRIPFRSEDGPPSMICDKSYDDQDFEALILELKEVLPQTLLFTYHLQSVSFDKWQPNESTFQNYLTCRVSSSPLSRRNHLEEVWENSSWRKDKSKLGKLFKSSWSPLRTSHTIRICSRLSDEDSDINDTYLIMSILAPPRLREMACTESLAPVNLLPFVTIAAHVHRDPSTKELDTTEYKPAEGCLFVGLPTGIKTGLPYHINAPLFLNEWTGDVMLEKEDDDEFKLAVPGIRNVNVVDKHNTVKTRALALYVWNRQALLSTTTQLIPSMMKELKNSIHLFMREQRLLYRFWPYFGRVRPRYKDFMDSSIYTQLAGPDMDIYLTEKDGFKSIRDGCFASPEYKLNDAADFFLQRMALFTTPKLVVEDLNRLQIDGRQLTPSVARNALKSGRHINELKGRPREVLAVLEYCLADLINENDFSSTSPAARICRQELMGLSILPLSDGTIGKFGSQIIIATAAQQSMLPAVKNKFLWPRATTFLEQFISKPGFMDVCGLQHFGPKTLSQYVSTALPQSWEGKNFVKWDEDSIVDGGMNIPTKLWIYQFWKEVSIWDHDVVQLFRRWPLIPTKSGELASCGNARFILYICTSGVNEALCSSLADSLAALHSNIEKDDKCDLVMLSAERRLRTNSMASPNSDVNFEEFWEMGKVDNDSIVNPNPTPTQDDEETPVLIDASESENIEISEIEEAINDDNSLEEFHDVPPSDSDESVPENILSNQPMNNAPGYDPSSSSLQSLFEILKTIQCPLLEASFFTEEEMTKILPADRLGITRVIMGTLNQCINYWTSNDSADESRLQWSALSPDQFDEFLTHLSSSNGNRLSLMVSDLTTMKSLPLFETFSGTHIAISDRDQNFTLDNSVEIDSIRAYLPLSLQRKLLVDKSQFKDLYEDLNIRVLDEASILEQFVLKEFPSMPISQKEIVIKNILDKWSILSQSDDFINVLKETAFVKRKENSDNGEIVFVKPDQVFDPRNELLNLIFDEDRSCFPAEEFATEESLSILETLGLQTAVDKDTFLKCAWIVEGEQSVPKAVKLFEYFNDHFGEFFDNNRGEFIQNLAEVCCVPTTEDQSLSLCRFRDAAAPKDKHLVFKVMPIIHSSATPPQVMFSSLGIISPPPISVVLKQLRALIEDGSILDHWTYKHGTVETVFSEIFSYLQDNYDDLSPRVKEGLQERAIVPVGTTLVKANRLFFRLAKDLSPFFYEVPRAFGAYDVLLRNFGVRDNPRSGDYALSLLELNREIGESRLNANELKSVIEVVSLAASNDENLTGEPICAPDLDGKLVNVNDLLLNDQPWLVNSRKLDLKKIHLCHPKLNKELLEKLQIRRMSQQVHEVLDDQLTLKIAPDSSGTLQSMKAKISSNEFISTLLTLVPKKSQKSFIDSIQKLDFVKVEEIKTRFVLVRNGRSSAIDITNRSNTASALCFISKGRVLVSNLPLGVNSEIVVASSLCDTYNISRQHIGGIAALLSAPPLLISEIKSRMGLYGDEFDDELLRGDPGQPLVATDRELATMKPLKVFKQGEIVAVRSPNNSDELIYGVVTEFQDGSSLSRLSVSIGKGQNKTYLTTEVFSLGRSTAEESSTSVTVEEIDMSCLEGDIISGGEGINEFEDALVTNNNGNQTNMTAVTRTDVLKAVQDLLQSADLSLNHNAKNMLDSNLSLQEALSQKDREIKLIEKKTNDMARKAMSGVDAFLCPITRDPMEDPVICCDGHTYERVAIEMWLRNNSRSPKTNQQLPSKELIPNHALRSTIEAMGTLRESISGVVPNWEEEE